MMYSNKLVACIKANNKVLREDKENVYLPFGCEYSILIKNLNTVRVLVSVSIDGTDTTENTQLVILPNDEIELKRFIKNGNLDSGNAFKFIERTTSIEDHRGSKVDDGFIRIEFQFEKATPVVTTTHTHYYHNHRYYSPFYESPYGYSYVASPRISGQLGGNYGSYSSDVFSHLNQVKSPDSASMLRSLTNNSSPVQATAQSLTEAPKANNVGITVPGSKVEQQFKAASSFATEDQKHVLILRLVGEVGNVQVTAPITVSTKPKCVTCGKTNKANAKFCINCGTSLSII